MSREIRFRGKVKTGQWVYGFFTIGMDSFFIEERHELPPSMSDPCGDTIIARDEVDPKTVGQYTGLKDKNGVEIYEGDVVRHFVKSEYLDKSDWETVEGKVIFSTVEGNWIVETRRHPLYGFENEVLGNIHTLDTNT